MERSCDGCPTLLGQMELYTPVSIELLAERAVDSIEPNLFMLMLARHVVQRAALHPIRQAGLNTMVAERDQIDWFFVLSVLSSLNRRRRLNHCGA